MLKYQIIKRNHNDLSFLVNPDQYAKDAINIKANVINVDVKYLEALLDKSFGCKLADIPLGGGRKQANACKKLIDNYSNECHDGYFFAQLSEDIYGENLKPSAMLYKSTAEMMKSVFIMYQLSYAHYVLGRFYGMKGKFPMDCCGISTRNLLSALWEAGIVSAVQVYNSHHDHVYLVVPFILQKPHTSGVVLIDPTSDKLVCNKGQKIRNNVIVMTKKCWSYLRDHGANLYPDIVEISACYGRENHNYGDYIKLALKNPVVVV